MKASSAIAIAIKTGCLCRPVEDGWAGEALEVTEDIFYKKNTNGDTYPCVLTPLQFTMDWEVLGHATVAEEIHKMAVNPWEKA